MGICVRCQYIKALELQNEVTSFTPSNKQASKQGSMLQSLKGLDTVALCFQMSPNFRIRVCKNGLRRDPPLAGRGQIA